MGRTYANPPLEEAVCEFRLTSETRWDLTVPGLLYEKLKESFPQKEQRMIQEVELTQGPEGLQQQIRTSERLLFFAEDRKMLVQVGLRLLVINTLKPYPHWEGLKPRIAMVWKSLQDTVDVRGLERIGLRYINRIELPHRPELREYFEFYPFVGPRLPETVTSFFTGVEFSYADDRDRCRVQLTPAVVSAREGKAAFILDLDYFLARPGGVGVADVLDWIEEAHSRVEDLFEGCITDNLRKMFQEVSV